MSVVYSKGIEVVAGVFILNDQNQVLLIRSHKWKNRILSPGGHVDPGESIQDASMREAKEETGLDTSFVGVIRMGRDIFSNTDHYHRVADMLWFHVLLKYEKGDLVIDSEEVISADWYNLDSTDESISDITKGTLEAIREHLDGKRELIKLNSILEE